MLDRIDRWIGSGPLINLEFYYFLVFCALSRPHVSGITLEGGGVVVFCTLCFLFPANPLESPALAYDMVIVNGIVGGFLRAFGRCC